jgi:hypothetical protein
MRVNETKNASADRNASEEEALVARVREAIAGRIPALAGPSDCHAGQALLRCDASLRGHSRILDGGGSRLGGQGPRDGRLRYRLELVFMSRTGRAWEDRRSRWLSSE